MGSAPKYNGNSNGKNGYHGNKWCSHWWQRKTKMKIDSYYLPLPSQCEQALKSTSVQERVLVKVPIDKLKFLGSRRNHEISLTVTQQDILSDWNQFVFLHWSNPDFLHCVVGNLGGYSEHIWDKESDWEKRNRSNFDNFRKFKEMQPPSIIDQGHLNVQP